MHSVQDLGRQALTSNIVASLAWQCPLPRRYRQAPHPFRRSCRALACNESVDR